jgi:hypothetical protein
MNECLQSPDMVISCALFSLCLFVPPNIAASRTFVVPGVQSSWTSKLLEKTNETFEIARPILTIIRVAPECPDIVRLVRLHRGTRSIRILTKIRRVGWNCEIGFLGLF